MCTTNNSTIAERINQLRCSVQKFLSSAYGMKENGWKDLDAQLRTIEEQICIILAYSILGDQAATSHLTSDYYGVKLADEVKKICRARNITDTTIIDAIHNDISTHNQNCHGSNVSLVDREISGKTNVEASLPLVASILKNDLPQFLSPMKQFQDAVKRFGYFMDDADTCLKKPTFDVKLMEKYEKAVSTYPQDAQPGPYYFCLLLPSNPSDELMEKLRPLFMMQWAFILDEGFEDGKAFQIALQINPEGIQNTSAAKVLNANLTNWIFLQGYRAEESRAEIRKYISKLSKKSLPERNIVIVDLIDDKAKALGYIKQLWQFIKVDSVGEPSQLSSIITIGDAFSLKKLLQDDDYEVSSISEVTTSPDDFLAIATAQRLFPGPTFYGDISNGINYAEYHGGGIKFLDSDEKRERRSLWDEFYAGRQISIEELGLNRDVYPRGKENSLRDFENSIRDAIRNPEVSELMIVHQPGAGASTLLRRIAFNLKKDNQATTAFLVNFDSKLTIDLLAKLAESLKGNGRLLIVADDKSIDALTYDSLKSRLRNRGVYPVFIRVLHKTDLSSINSSKSTLKLKSSITESMELTRFDDKFKSYYLQFLSLQVVEDTLKNIHAMESYKGNGVEMIFYPYAFTERLKIDRAHKVYPTSSYVEKWFNEIKDNRLRALCGMVAFVYHFTTSKGLEAFSVAKLWKSEKNKTLQSFGRDFDSMLHILKFSLEETNSGMDSTNLSPRYAIFAKAILDNWKPGWENNLSIIGRQVINALPEDLSQESESLVLDLFVQQARLHSCDIPGFYSNKLSDKFSLLIGKVLEGDDGFKGAKLIFEALIEKYPENPFFKIHFGRLLYEFAHANKYSPDDELFSQSADLIEEAISISEFDDFFHMSGMYEYRLATAWGRMISSAEEDEPREYIEENIKECVERALYAFNKCNELNLGSSPYGYVSMADMLFSAISNIAKIRQIDKFNRRYLDESPFIEYLDLIDDALGNLRRLSEEEDNKENPLVRLQTRYLELIGKSEQAIALTKDKYLRASNDLKPVYGHRLVSMINGEMRKDESRREFYCNMTNSRLTELITLLKELDDLRSAEALFTVLRYTSNDEFGKGQTSDALMRWHTIAKEKNNSYHLLRATFFLYISYAAQLSVATSINTYNRDRYKQYKTQCKVLVTGLPDDIFKPSLFLGKQDIHKWNSILDSREAREYDYKQGAYVYNKQCRKVSGRLVEVKDFQAFCDVNFLTGVSLKRGDLRNNEIGKTWLRNGVIGFRYTGPGLFKFDIDRNGIVEASDKGGDLGVFPHTETSEEDLKPNSDVSSEQKKGFDPVAENASIHPNDTYGSLVSGNAEVFKLDSEKALKPLKVLGKIELPKNFSSNRKRKR